MEVKFRMVVTCGIKPSTEACVLERFRNYMVCKWFGAVSWCAFGALCTF